MIVKCQKINNNIMKMKQKVWYRIKNLLILKIKTNLVDHFLNFYFRKKFKFYLFNKIIRKIHLIFNKIFKYLVFVFDNPIDLLI